MQKYKIEIKPLAEIDLDNIYKYIAEDSPQSALLWYQHLITKIYSLESMPERCQIAPESKGFRQDIRHLIVRDYRILFTVEDDTIQVLHVRGKGQEL